MGNSFSPRRSVDGPLPRATRLVAALALVALGGGAPDAEARGPARDQTLIALGGRDDAGLNALLDAQQDPASPDYRRLLTPGEFGRRFGAAPRDVKRWSPGCARAAAG